VIIGEHTSNEQQKYFSSLKKFKAIIIAIFFSSFLFAQDVPPEQFPRERTFDIIHYRLNIRVDEKLKTISGTNTITLVPIRSKLFVVKLDAADLNISEVSIHRHDLKFDVNKTKEELHITLDKPYTPSDTLQLTIVYSASPQKGLYFIQPDSAYPQNPWQVWSQGEAEDNRYWFPCYDYPNDKSTSEMIITVSQKFISIGNGQLLDVKINDANNTKAFHWYAGKPHSSYLISLVVGEYEQIKDTWNKVPLYYYVYKGQKKLAPLSFSNTPKMMQIFSDAAGFNYPWEKYSQTVVRDFVYGGMENVSAATLTDETIHDDRAHLDYQSDGLIAHELAHQWFGNLLTCKDWSNAWLNEGFATYLGTYYFEAANDADEAAYEWYSQLQNIISTDVGENRRPTVTNHYFYPMDIFDNKIYAKGSVILNMLRNILGDDLFFKAIRYYTNKHAYGLVETKDFILSIEEATGENLQWFFDQWVYKAGYPEFEVKYEWDADQRAIKLNVKQVQTIDSLTGIFTTPIDVEIWQARYPKIYRIFIDKAEQEFVFPSDNPPKNLVFDKGSKILMNVYFEKSVEEWLFQLQYSESIDRLVAIKMLAPNADEPLVKQALSKLMFNDRRWFVRAEAARVLGTSTHKSTAELLIDAYRDKNSKVRNAVVREVSNFHGENITRFLKNVFEKDSSYLVREAALHALINVDSQNAFTYCQKALIIDYNNKRVRTASISGLSKIGHEEAYKLILTYTKYGVETEIRRTAIIALSEKWPSRLEIIEIAEKMLMENNFNIRLSAIIALNNIGSARAVELLKTCLISEKQVRLKKQIREALARLINTN
jgi:aminopeptidase N